MKKNEQNEPQSAQNLPSAAPAPIVTQQPTAPVMPAPIGMPAPGAMQAPIAMPVPGAMPPGAVPVGFQGTGSTLDNSYDAPKVIQSKKITEFSANFFARDDEDDSLSGNYYFVLKNEDGKLILKEDFKYRISVEVTPDVFDTIQKIIEKNNLVSMNGTDRITQGLPADHQPCSLNAVYDSGEKLHFSMNNNPTAQWGRELETALRNEFAKRGHKECLAPASANNIVNFHINYLENNLSYKYNTIKVDKEGRFMLRSVYDKAKDDMHERIIEIPDGFIADFNEYLKSNNFKRFHNGQMPFGSDWKQGKERYYDFYVEYENSRTIVGFSTESTDCDLFYASIPELKAFLDKYFDDPKAQIYRDR